MIIPHVNLFPLEPVQYHSLYHLTQTAEESNGAIPPRLLQFGDRDYSQPSSISGEEQRFPRTSQRNMHSKPPVPFQPIFDHSMLMPLCQYSQLIQLRGVTRHEPKTSMWHRSTLGLYFLFYLQLRVRLYLCCTACVGLTCFGLARAGEGSCVSITRADHVASRKHFLFISLFSL